MKVKTSLVAGLAVVEVVIGVRHTGYRIISLIVVVAMGAFEVIIKVAKAMKAHHTLPNQANPNHHYHSAIATTHHHHHNHHQHQAYQFRHHRLHPPSHNPQACATIMELDQIPPQVDQIHLPLTERFLQKVLLFGPCLRTLACFDLSFPNDLIYLPI